MKENNPQKSDSHWLLERFYKRPFYIVFSTILVILDICIFLFDNTCELKRLAFGSLVIIVVLWARRTEN